MESFICLESPLVNYFTPRKRNASEQKTFLLPCQANKINLTKKKTNKDHAIEGQNIYRYENLISMKKRESLQPKYNETSLYIPHRRHLIDWTCQVGHDLRLSKVTCHIACLHLDRLLLQEEQFPEEKLPLVALSCIFLACKMDENERNIPSISEIWEYGRMKYYIEDIKRMEARVIARLQWRLLVVVPLDFIQFYLNDTNFFYGDKINQNQHSTIEISKLPKYYEKYATFFSDFLLQEYKFQKYPASLLAAAILIASRKVLKICPTWRKEFAVMSGHKLDNILACYEAIWSYYTKVHPEANDSNDFDSPTTVSNYPCSNFFRYN